MVKTIFTQPIDNVLPAGESKADSGFKDGVKVVDIACSKISRHVAKKGLCNKNASLIFSPPDPVAPPVPRIGALKLHTDPFAADRAVTISPSKKKILTPRRTTPERRGFKHVEQTLEQKKAAEKQEKISMGPFIAVAGQMITGGKKICAQKNQTTVYDENKWWKQRFGSAPKPVCEAKVQLQLSNVFSDSSAAVSAPAEEVHRVGKKIASRRPSLEGVFKVIDNKAPRPLVSPPPFRTDDQPEGPPPRAHKKRVAAPTMDENHKEFQAPKKKLLGPPPTASPYIHSEQQTLQQPNKAAAGYKGLQLPFATSRSPSQQLMIC